MLLGMNTYAGSVVFDFTGDDAYSLFGFTGFSTNDSGLGDFTETKSITKDGVSLVVSPSEGKTPNRMWSGSMRLYGGMLMFASAEEITKIEFELNSGKWSADNYASTGTLETGLWTGNAQNVSIVIAGNTQIKKITVTTGEGADDPSDSDSLFDDFDFATTKLTSADNLLTFEFTGVYKEKNVSGQVVLNFENSLCNKATMITTFATVEMAQAVYQEAAIEAADEGYASVDLEGTTVTIVLQEDFVGSSYIAIRSILHLLTEKDAEVGMGNLESPLNPVSANVIAGSLGKDEVSKEDYFIKGKIASIKHTFNADYGTATFFISTDGQDDFTFQCYSVNFLENKPWVEGNEQIKVGDEVIICGKLVNYKGTTPETASNKAYIYSLNGKTAAGGETPVADARVWDFTKWSDATVANLKADAAASKTAGWSDVEKASDAENNADPTEASKDNCFWSVASANEDGTISANGQVIEELKGLLWNSKYTVRRSLAIAVNYPSALNDYAGPAYLWLGGGKNKIPCFTIPGVKAGSTITMEVESHKGSEGRGVELYAGVDEDGLVDASTKIGDSFTPKTLETHTWTIENDCDVIVYNTNGCHIYTIKVEAAGGGTPAPILTLKGTVGTEVTLTFGAYDSEDTYSVDFGNGELLSQPVGIENKGPVKEDGTTGSATTFTGTVAGDGTIKVYGTNDIWYFLVSGDALPTSFDQPKLKNVVQMSFSGANAESVALPAFEKLTQFSFTNSPVKSVDVSKVATLTSLSIFNTTQSAYEPQLAAIDISKNVNLETIILGGNTYQKGKITELDVTNNTKLTQISAENNKISKIIGLPASLKNLYVSNNELADITFPEFTVKGTIQIQNNKFTLGTLPKKPAITSNSKYTYAPQPAYQVAETLGVLDLTSQLTATGILEAPVQTTFSFVTASGAALVEGTDYAAIEPGKFAFIKEQSEKVHAVMASEAFPKFTGNNAYVTSEFTVDAAAGLASVNGILTQKEPAQLYNLNGQKVMNPTKGLYIQKGKKVLVAK